MFLDKDDPEAWVLGSVLAHQARTRPAAIFVEMIGGGSLSFAEAEQDAWQVAAYFASP